MNKTILFFLSLIISILVSFYAQGITYYISPSGNDNNTGTSTDTPWATIARAFLAVSPGDTVYLRGGTYSGYANLYRSGTSGNPITFRNYSGETPVIDGSGKTTDPSNPWIYTNNLINIEASYIIFMGLELKNSAGFGIEFQQGSNYCIVDQCYFHNCYFAGVYFYKCSYGQVTNCVAHDFYDYGVGGTGGGGNADGMGSSAGNDKPYPDYGYHIFRNNLVYNCSDDGIDTWSSRGNIVENNIVHHAGYGNASNGGSQSSTWGKPQGNGNGFKCGGASTSGNNILRNNVSYSNVTSGFDENGGSGNKYYNNTAYSTVVGFRNLSASSAVNNIAYSNSVNCTGGTQSNNSWDLGITNPQFLSTDPASPVFLQLSAGSPAIDAGVDLSAEGVLTDRLGIVRPFGAGYDLGAYECSSLPSGISETEQINMKIFPNPAMYGNNITVKSNKMITGYKIMNLFGKLEAEGKGLSDNSIIINKDELPSGIYLIQVYTKEGILGIERFSILK
jgi:parallel beta-helix repeat protein